MASSTAAPKCAPSKNLNVAYPHFATGKRISGVGGLYLCFWQWNLYSCGIMASLSSYLHGYFVSLCFRLSSTYPTTHVSLVWMGTFISERALRAFTGNHQTRR